MTHVSSQDLAVYQRDGVVLLKKAFEQHWIEELLRGLDENVAKPGPMSRYYAQDRAPDWFFYDTLNWSRVGE